MRRAMCVTGIRFRWMIAGIVLLPMLPLASALATPPAQNGDIAFRRHLGPDRTKGTIFMAAPNGTGERQLAKPPPAPVTTIQT